MRRLRQHVRELGAALLARLRRRVRPVRPPVRGRMQNVIVLKPPDPRFKEAVFILRDDYFLSEELNRQELLLQAREAAQDYLASLLPPPRRRSPLLPLLLLSAALLAWLHLAGIL